MRKMAIVIVALWNTAAAGYVLLFVEEGLSSDGQAGKFTVLFTITLLVGLWLLGNVLFAVAAVFAMWFSQRARCPHGQGVSEFASTPFQRLE